MYRYRRDGTQLPLDGWYNQAEHYLGLKSLEASAEGFAVVLFDTLHCPKYPTETVAEDA
jgi:hypothetical protein